MFEIYVILCTLNGECMHRRIPIVADHPPNLYECTVVAQAQTAGTLDIPPGYGLKWWSCGPPTKDT